MPLAKSPTKAERAAKPVSAFSANQSLSDIVRMIAGHAEARNDVIVGAVFSAYFQALKHGNKAQLQGRASSLYEQAKMYSTAKACKEAGFAQPQKAAVLYAAHLSALDVVGIPEKATIAQLVDGDGNATTVEVMAEGMALAYMDVVQAYIADDAAIKAEKRAASKAAQAKAAPSPEAAKAVGEALGAAKADQQANSVPVLTMTMAEMVAAVTAALRTGTLDADLHNQIADAAAEYSELEALREQVAPALAGMAMPAGEVAAALAA